jgi:hypothetical protein
VQTYRKASDLGRVVQTIDEMSSLADEVTSLPLEK